MKDLFDQFLKEKRYLKNLSQNTLVYLEHCFKAFSKHGGGLSKAGVQQFVIGMKEAGISTGACNAYIRGINSFLSWLHENEHTTDHLKIKYLKDEQRVLKTFSDSDIKRIVSFKPTTFYEFRMHALLCLLCDTGIRIDEAVTLTRSKIDFDNLLITVLGKGNKERVIPISYELRKILYKFLQKHKFDTVFPNRHGGRLLYDNLRRDFNDLLKKLGIEKTEGSFHAFRRYFAKNYVKQGGNLFYLQKTLGHTTLRMTQKYVEVETEALKEAHLKTSALSRLK